MADYNAQPEITMNFHSDWTSLLRAELATMGFHVPDDDEEFDICLKYFNALRRRIVARPRRVLLSREFSCPRGCKSGLHLIEDKIRVGQNLNPHLGRRITDSTFNDQLLNDWRVYHFHLGTRQDDSGLIQRTDFLLFAWVTDNEFYMLDVMSHGNWARQRLIEILHANWPRLIEPWKCEGVLALSQRPSDQDVTTLRSGGINTMIQTDDGTVYFPTGGGYTCKGASREVVKRCVQARKVLKQMEDSVKEHIEKMGCQEILGSQGRHHFRLVFDEQGTCAMDDESSTQIPLLDARLSSIVFGHPR